MKSKIIILIAVILVVLGYYVFVYEPEYSGAIKSDGSVKIFSHRGLGDYAPDNSLVGAEIAMNEGFFGVDVDAQMTSDGEVIIFHDLSIDRLTNNSGKVKDKTKEEMLTLDLADKFVSRGDRNFDDAYVATFEDFVKSITASGTLMVELKVPGAGNTGMEHKVVDIISKHDAWEKVYLSSFNPLVLYRLKQIDRRVKTVYIFMDTNWNPQLLAEIKPEDLVNLPWFVRSEFTRKLIRKIIKPDALSVNNEVDEDTINQLIEKGHPVFLWTINDQERMKWAKYKKPYAIISDEPFVVREILNN